MLDRNYVNGIANAIEQLATYLSVDRDTFLADKMRQHAVAYQLCLWAHWAKLLGGEFSFQYPRLDVRDTSVRTWRPDWKEIWEDRKALPALREELREVASTIDHGSSSGPG